MKDFEKMTKAELIQHIVDRAGDHPPDEVALAELEKASKADLLRLIVGGEAELAQEEVGSESVGLVACFKTTDGADVDVVLGSAVSIEGRGDQTEIGLVSGKTFVLAASKADVRLALGLVELFSNG